MSSHESSKRWGYLSDTKTFLSGLLNVQSTWRATQDWQGNRPEHLVFRFLHSSQLAWVSRYCPREEADWWNYTHLTPCPIVTFVGKVAFSIVTRDECIKLVGKWVTEARMVFSEASSEADTARRSPGGGCHQRPRTGVPVGHELFNSLIYMYTGGTNMQGKPIYIVWGYP